MILKSKYLLNLIFVIALFGCNRIIWFWNEIFIAVGIITAYLGLQNVFDRQNIYAYYWNEDYKELSTIYQWAFFPVGGISFQF